VVRDRRAPSRPKKVASKERSAAPATPPARQNKSCLTQLESDGAAVCATSRAMARAKAAFPAAPTAHGIGAPPAAPDPWTGSPSPRNAPVARHPSAEVPSPGSRIPRPAPDRILTLEPARGPNKLEIFPAGSSSPADRKQPLGDRSAIDAAEPRRYGPSKSIPRGAVSSARGWCAREEGGRVAGEPSIAVVGCGHWGKNLVRNLAELGVLRSVVDPSPAALERVAKTCPGVQSYTALDEALADPGVRGVMIATPAETHYAHACAALRSGKDVFVEKPLTVDVDEGHDLIARAEAAGRVLMVGHLLEYHPAIVSLKGLVRSGELGKLRYVTSNRLNLGKIRTEENALWSFAPHDIGILLSLVGEMPFEVVATGGCYVQPNIADVTVTSLLFDNGVRSHIYVSWLHPFKEQKLVVVGSRKMATYDDVQKQLLLYDLHVNWTEGQPVPVSSAAQSIAFGAGEPLRLECEHFVACVRTRQQPLTDGPYGLRVLRILQAAQRSLMTNGRPVALAPDSEAAGPRLGAAHSAAPKAGPPWAPRTVV